MLVLGDIQSGYSASESDVVLPDGRVVGPFESESARGMFLEQFGRKSKNLFAASQLFDGSVWGDEYHLLNLDEMSLETHPYREIHDIWTTSDNGSPVFEMPRGFSVVDPARIIYVSCPITEMPKRTLPAPIDPKPQMDLEPHSTIITSYPSRGHGQIGVADIGTGGDERYLVFWRRDGRQTKELTSISLHMHESVALKVARQRADDYVPTREKRTNRQRDGQREKLYRWQHSFASQDCELADIGEARELSDKVCDSVGVRRIPDVRLGRPTLLTYSYYRHGQMVLSQSMLRVHTVVHESAHHVVSNMKRVRDPGHGPIFAGVLLALMEEHMGVDAEDAIEKARESGVVVDLDVFRYVRDRIAEIKSTRSPQSAMMRPTH